MLRYTTLPTHSELRPQYVHEKMLQLYIVENEEVSGLGSMAFELVN